MDRRPSDGALYSANSSSANVNDHGAKDGAASGSGDPNVSVSTFQSTVESADADQDRVVEEILHSDIGISTLLNRLKQSMTSCRDFAAFIKKRAGLEEEHAAGLRKLCRFASEAIQRPDARKGTYAKQFEDTTRIHNKLADHGLHFAEELQKMHEDLNEMVAAMERGRKFWKAHGMSSEKRVHDMELLMEKSKAKYDSIADEYERVRSPDKRTKPSFSALRTGKHGAALEEELQRRVQAADAEYLSKVNQANGQRSELLHQARPKAVKALKDMIFECDAGLTYHLQRFATLNERLLLNNGMSVSPLKTPVPVPDAPQSMRDVVAQIDNEKDFRQFVLAHLNKVPRTSKTAQIPYERHPSLNPQLQLQRQQEQAASQRLEAQSLAAQQAAVEKARLEQQQQMAAAQQQQQQGPYGGQRDSAQSETSLNENGEQRLQQQQQGGAAAQQQQGLQHGHKPSLSELPRIRPTFGVSLDELSERDGNAVPIIVNQCIQAVDLYGMDVEGIYRVSGTQSHIQHIKAMFDNKPEEVDFRSTASFFNDVNSVASVLKMFFRDLPDPLFTSHLYPDFISAARIDDDNTRRDSLHALINCLPDPNYATLRALVLHLNRIQDRQKINRMTAANLAIPFGPTLLSSGGSPNIADASAQVRVVETVLMNCFSIFEPDV